MDIEHATEIVLHEVVRQQAHETGKNHQPGFKAVDECLQGLVEGLAGFKAGVVQCLGGNTGVTGPLQPFGVRAVADHGADLDRQFAVGDRTRGVVRIEGKRQSDLAIRFLRPAQGERAYARADLEKAGRLMVVGTVRIWMDDRFETTVTALRDFRCNFSRGGDVAWFSTIVDDCYEWDGNPGCWQDTRWTGVLEKRAGRWVTVQMHGSVARDRVLLEARAAGAAEP